MVKDYYCLTEQEKQLLRDYKLWNQDNAFTFLMFFIADVFYFVMIFIGILYSLIYIMGGGILGVWINQLATYWYIKQTRKTNRMIFGFDNAKKYFFEINKKDVKMSIKEFVIPEQKEE